MSKLKSKQDVVEWYWPDFLGHCIRMNTPRAGEQFTTNPKELPTIDNFWIWYITVGPMGVKHRNLYYTKEEIEYV